MDQIASFDTHNAVTQLWLAELTFPHVVRTNWITSREALDEIFKNPRVTIKASNTPLLITGQEGIEIYGLLPEVPVSFIATGTTEKTYFRIAGKTHSDCAKGIALLKEFLPEVVAPPASIPMALWYYGPDGAMTSWRNLTVPNWNEIEKNYSTNVQNAIRPIVDPGWRPLSGNVFLFHGQPGTGKTYCIRALTKEWRTWADLNYISDPEKFLGGTPSYLLQVTGNAEDNNKKWTILILEDSGELMRADAKEQTGQALSRLLNLSDGFLGQGLNVLTIITTNETLDKIHPALQRPGRASLVLRFDSLNHIETKCWVQANGMDPNLFNECEHHTVAELYAIKNGASHESMHKSDRKIGLR